MIRIRRGKVETIIESRSDLQILEILIEDERVKAVHYPQIGGIIRVGQEVVLNTTARKRGLGTGGYDFVLYAEGNDYYDPQESGHIMKLRYTPWQIKVLSVEEEDSRYHQKLKEADSIESMPVLVAPLHSMVTPIAAVIKAFAPDVKIVYLMSDGGALPLSFSKQIRNLQDQKLLDGTVTFGHAFGGDCEAVNVYSGLLAAKWVLKADIGIITMGPGIVGTGTPYGFTGVEQADFLHAVSILQGIPIAIPRISFADERFRHQGISHHSQTVLGKLTLIKALIGLPELPIEKQNLIEEQIKESGLAEKHQISFHYTDEIEPILEQDDLHLQTMGRDYFQDREFFLTAGLGGLLALKTGVIII